MTIATLERALKKKKPAVIKEKGAPRFVILDWDTYKRWEETKEDLEDSKRLLEAIADLKNQKRISLSQAKKTLKLP